MKLKSTFPSKVTSFFISLENKNGAMQFDKVEVEILPEIIGKNPEGKITKIYTDAFKDNVLSLDEILSRNRIEKKHSLKAINQIKKMHIEKSAAQYLFHKKLFKTTIRFDAIEILIKEGKCQINHIKQII